MTDQSKHDQMLALVERLRLAANTANKTGATWVSAQDLTAALDEIERLRESLRFYAWENETRLPSEGPWGVNSTDFGKLASEALKGG